jgi:ATP-dependent Clp protease protease subunit
MHVAIGDEQGGFERTGTGRHTEDVMMDQFFGVPGTYNQYPPYQRTREMSLSDMLLENRIIFLAGPIVERTASTVIQQLLYLQSIKRNQDVNLYINSPGGLVDQTLAIYDTMQFMGCEVATYCIGQAASGAAVILMAGTKGKRYILPNAKVMLHQPYGGITGQAEDIRIQAEEVLRDKGRINQIISKCTGRSVEEVTRDTERDRYLNAEEAVAYSIVDEVLDENSSKKIEEKKS